MEGRREEVVTNDSFRAVTGKDDEVDYVFQKDARRGDTRRRSQQGGGGEYNSATWKPVFHRQTLSTRETASRTTNDEQEGWVTAVSPVSFSPSLAAIDRRGERRRERENRKEEEGEGGLALERSPTRPLENEERDWKTYPPRLFPSATKRK